MRSTVQKKIPLLLTIALVLTAIPLGVVAAASQTLSIAPGDSWTVTCSTTLTGTISNDQASLTCAPVPSPTSTPIASSTPTRTPTPTAALPGQPCPQALHDSYVVTGPDGKVYPTWHPPVDPVYGCYFGHEHGSDPRTSKANSALPAF